MEDITLGGKAIDDDENDSLGEEVALALAAQMAKNWIRTLDLTGNRISAGGLSAMLRAVANPTGKTCRLEKLLLTNVTVPEESVSALEALLEAAQGTLKEVNLEDGGEYAANAVCCMRDAPKLEIVVLAYAGVEDGTCSGLMDVVAGWPKLKVLNLEGAEAEEEVLAALEGVLAACGKRDCLMLDDDGDYSDDSEEDEDE